MSMLKGKTVVITGASRGIGEAAARAFAGQGAKVALMARSAQALQALAQDIGGLALAVDIADQTQVAKAFNTVEAELGPVDILINNAGMIDPIGALVDVDADRWGQLIDVNLKGVFYGMQAVIPAMVARGDGTIITISSGAAHRPLEGWSAYCSSKAAAKMLTEAADLEYGGKGLRIMGLSPGTVATQMQKEIKASGINVVSTLEWEDHIPPEWPADCLIWMCGAAGDGLKGQEVSLRDEDVRRAVGLI